MDRFLELADAENCLAELVARAKSGAVVVITQDGRPVARLGSPEPGPAHRAKEARRNILLLPEFEPGEARLARMAREGDVPHNWRKLPRQ